MRSDSAAIPRSPAIRGHPMAEAVYVLCAIAGLACAVLLARAYFRTPSRLLLWSSLCFAALAANSIIVAVDQVLFPAVDLRALRIVVAVLGLVPFALALLRERH